MELREILNLSTKEISELAEFAELGGNMIEELAVIGVLQMGVMADPFIYTAYAIGRRDEKKQGVKTFIVRDES